MHFVFVVIAFRIISTSILYVGISTSTKTGTRPYCRIGVTVAGNPAATEITSSPGFKRFSPSLLDVKAEKANKFADEPEFVSIT